ncbi:TolC family protein [Desulfobacula phenolica]|uniref:Outer membrane protein TolC n=1 Tax=Desulfobacula phenolica TaxID=90732 RepID=A0A1H2IF65_9BACT|nr:TolC family protein [Desulfobacula phenolica]SDU42733.1 Outer membrane protein TolC [Desulfobacula phenolica]
MYKIKLIFLILMAICIFCKTTLYAEGHNHPVLSLSKAVDIAVRNFAAVQQAEENLKGADFDRLSIKADLLPAIKANYNFTTLANNPYMVQNNRQVQVAHSNQYYWDITVSQPLFAGFALSTNYEISKLNVKIKKKDKIRTCLDVVKGVKKAYYQLLLARKILDVTDDTVDYLTAHENDARRFYQRGLTRRNDLLRTQVTLANAVQNREQAKAGLEFAVSDLNRWLAYEINQQTEIEDIVTVTEKDYRLESLVEYGLQNRPVLQAMHLMLEVFEKAVKLEKSDYYPKVSLFGSYQQDGDSLAAQDNDYYNDHNALIGVHATWTLFDASKRKSKIASAKADKRAFKKQIRLAVDQIKLEIKDAYLNCKVARNNIKTSRASLTSARENSRITCLGYRQQVATSTEVLDARADLTQAQSNYFQSLYGYLNAVAKLDRAIGKRIEI